ncbi:hypothetical protein DV736_g24, partial [Chaetothyriales sp. CBS 134916]
MAQALLDVFYSLSNCLFCFPASPQLKINSRSFRMLRLLGEGGFSYVYLVQDTADSGLYALKKIRCPFGQESVAQALKEVEAYTLFASNPNIIHSIDHAVQNDSSVKVSGIGDTGGVSKTVYILLPYYRRGNLQDAINANLVNHTRFSQRSLLKLMLGVCKALKAMHQYRIPSGNQNAASRAAAKAQHQHDLAEEQQAPLMTDNEVTRAQEGKKPGDVRAYAHRDIKPGNIMIDDDGDTPILMDLGSLAPSPTPITSRSQALAVQDTAAEHSTMPYRAPELFDVKTGSVIDTKVDIWSLGCTMYACIVGKSPFEARSDETGGSLSICVLGGDWRWPGEGNASKGKDKQPNSGANGSASPELYPCAPVRNIVAKCLQVEPSERPEVDELIGLIQDSLQHVPEDSGDVVDAA